MSVRARRSARAAAALASVAALAAAGCAGGNSPKIAVQPAPAAPPLLHAGPARPRDVAVIRGWSETLRAGRIDAASSYFRPPALVQNGSPELALPSVAAVRLFNASLPCGARLIEARRIGRYTIATFELTERPGGACGQGTGHRAATAFRFRAGKIVEWRRVNVPQFAPAPPASRRQPAQQV